MSSHARPLSARQRAPVAKSNVSAVDNTISRPKSATACRSGNTSINSPRSACSTPRGRVLERNGSIEPTLAQSKPYIPPTLPWTVDDTRSKFPPALAPSRFSTIPLPEEPPKHRYKKPPICPQQWLDAQRLGNSSSKSLAKLDLASLENPEVKLKLIREFIENNRDRLPRFNATYAGLDHRQVCALMMQEKNCAAMLLRYEQREQKLNASSSRFVKASLNDDPYNSLGEVRNDPFLMSLSTGRKSRDARLSQLFAPSAMKENNQCAETKFRRGYNHAPEYGNFSHFNGLLISNNCKLH